MKRVVIIGGGFAGTFSAKKLENDFDVTLVDNKDYFEFTPGILRTLIEPEHSKKIQVLHENYLKKTKIINGEVKSITTKEVLIKNKKIFFDYLIISSGSKYNLPIKAQNIVFATRAKILENCHEKLEKSNNILIIGGGIVGVELAAEIVGKYKNKNTSIIQFKDCLMERSTHKAQEYSQNYLFKKGVKIIFNEFVNSNKKNVFITDKGTEIKTDIAFMCTGISPNSNFMKQNFNDKLTERSAIKVNNYLQLENCSNIFVAGDVNNILEEKTAQNAEKQAKIVVNNINHLEAREGLEEYRSAPRIMVVSLGKYCGILTYKNFTLTGFLPGLFKTFIEWKIMRGYL